MHFCGSERLAFKADYAVRFFINQKHFDSGCI